MPGTTLFLSNISWDFVWQRHQTLASLFARDGQVVFCEFPGTRAPRFSDVPRLFRSLSGRRRVSNSVPPNVVLLRPLILPATNRAFCRINEWLLDRWLAHQGSWRDGTELVVTYTQNRTALRLLDRVKHRRMVYECTDDWLKVRGIPEFLERDERQLLQRSDLTIVPSHRLEELKRPLARRLVRIPHGVLFERFAIGAPPRGDVGTPVLLYYGHVHRQHLDFELLEGIARRRRNWRIELVGPVKTPHRFPPNVCVSGQLPHERLKDAIAKAHVLVLPYAINAYTASVLPAKTYECLASGRPIVATPLPELVAGFADSIRLASDAPAFVDAVEAALAEAPERAEARIALARGNTWAERYSRIRQLLESSGGE
jgi:glycosyltransferase involved in cell wall biosynthesis